jgi:hypothetical protein
LLLAGGAGVLLLAAAAVACFTAPPPDLPPQSTERPSIVSSGVVPGAYLTELPPDMTFIVPVQVAAGEFFQWDVFVDYQADIPADPNYPNPRLGPKTVSAGEAVTDGGFTWVNFTLGASDFPPGPCPHRIEFFVAHQFNPGTIPRTPESFGGDSFTWFYVPDGCSTYDAGDGAFPPADAPSDTVLVIPESGVDP